MAGHSKFKNIQHRKGAQDKKRAKIFAKLSKEITVAAKQGMPDPEANPRLRTAIAAARAQNMPNDRIKRAVEQGSPGGDSADYEEVRYEGYGPGGIAIIVEALTDNRNRTAADVRSAFNKHNGNLGETGSVAFMFDQVGSLIYAQDKAEFEPLFEAAVEAGALDVEAGDESHEVVTSVEDFAGVRDHLEQAFGEADEGALIWKPQNTITPDEDAASTLLKLIDALEDNDDVQTVHSNFDLPDEVLERLMAA